MNSKRSFVVINPKFNFWGCIGIMGFFVILVLAYTIFSPPPHTVMYVSITVFIFIPGTILALWTKMYRVKVNGTKISVRKRFGLVHFDLDICEISNVKWKIVDTRYGQTNNITVYTSKGKKFKIETIMENSNKFIKLLEDNIEEQKINKSYKSIG